MPLRFPVAASFAALGLAACATAAQVTEAPADPALCYTRDFNVYFDGRSTDVSPEATAVIDAVGEALRGCRIGQVRITGSTEAAGNAVANDSLAAARAVTLARYLDRHLHWPRSHMQTLAAGEHGAVTDEGLNVPMRARARIVVEAAAP